MLSDHQTIGRLAPGIQRKKIHEDSPFNKLDLLGREAYAREIASSINSTENDSAIGIAINGEWGFGKTFFINQISNELRNNPSNILIPFNPWIGEKDKSTLSLFIDQIESSLRPFDSKISSQIGNYLVKMSNSDEGDTFLIGAIKKSLSTLFPPNNLGIQKNEINTAIKSTGKRLIVILDDLDRLSGDELSDIIRLLRNTANFSNTIFIAALDRNYVSNIINESNTLHRKGQYLEKVFQLEITLPPMKKDIRVKYFLDCIASIIDKDTIEYKALEEAVRKLSNNNDFMFYQSQGRGNIKIIEKYLLSIRDVNRYFNGFKIVYQLANGEVEVLDLILLELIKLRSPSFYRLIANAEVMESGFLNSRWHFSQEKLDDIFKDEQLISSQSINLLDKQLFERTLRYLFPAPEENDDGLETQEQELIYPSRSAIYTKNHKFYFHYNPFGDFSINEFKSALDGGYLGLKSYIDLLSAENENIRSTESVENYLSFLETLMPRNINELKFITKSIVYSRKYLTKFNFTNFYNTFFGKEKLMKIHGLEGNLFEFNTFIEIMIVAANDIDLRDRAYFIDIILQAYIHRSLNNPFSHISSQQGLLRIYNQLFIDCINNNPEQEENIFSFLIGNLQLSNFTMLNEASLQQYRSYLNTYNSFFIKKIIYPHITPYETFWQFKFLELKDRIFDSVDDFKEFLLSNYENDCAVYVLEKYEELEQLEGDILIIADYNQNNPCI